MLLVLLTGCGLLPFPGPSSAPTPVIAEGLVLTAWPPAPGEALAEVPIRAWNLDADPDRGFQPRLLQGYFASDVDGVAVFTVDGVQLLDPRVTQPSPRLSDPGYEVADIQGVPDIDGDGRRDVIALLDIDPGRTVPSILLVVVSAAGLDAQPEGLGLALDKLGQQYFTLSSNESLGELGTGWSDGARVRVPVSGSTTSVSGRWIEVRGFRTAAAGITDTAAPPDVVRYYPDDGDNFATAIVLDARRTVVLDSAQVLDGVRIGRMGVYDGPSPGGPLQGPWLDVDRAPTVVDGDADHRIRPTLAAYPDVDGDGVPEVLVRTTDGTVEGTLAFLSTDLFSTDLLTPDDAAWRGPLVQLAPDVDGDGLPELAAPLRYWSSTDVSWTGEDLAALPPRWEGAFAPGGTPTSTTFLTVDGDVYALVGVP